MNKIITVIGIVYKTKDSRWRGFCYPYDVACFGDTKEEAMKMLTSMVESYEQILSKYNNPYHLVNNKLSEMEDQRVLNRLWPKINKKIAEIMEKTKKPSSNYLSVDRELKLNSSYITYSNRSLQPAYQ